MKQQGRESKSRSKFKATTYSDDLGAVVEIYEPDEIEVEFVLILRLILV